MAKISTVSNAQAGTKGGKGGKGGKKGKGGWKLKWPGGKIPEKFKKGGCLSSGPIRG